MARKRQREVALAVVAALLIAAAAYRIKATMPGDSSAIVQSGAPAGAGKAGASQKGAVASIDLDALQRDRPEPAASERNPFRFKPRPPPPPPPPPPRSSGGGPGGPDQTGPVEPPPPPRITLKFIGFIESPPGSPKVAIFSDGRNAPFYGREGETIEGQYRIVRIGVESVELAYLDGRGRQTIRQTGQ